MHGSIPLGVGALLSPTLNLHIGDRKGTTKKVRDKDFAERSGELSSAMSLKTLVLLGNEKLFGAVRAIFWLFVSPFWLLNTCAEQKAAKGDERKWRSLPAASCALGLLHAGPAIGTAAPS